MFRIDGEQNLLLFMVLVSANGVSAVQSSYPDRAAGLGQDPAAVETYAGV